jgi:hypothetical protein
MPRQLPSRPLVRLLRSSLPGANVALPAPISLTRLHPVGSTMTTLDHTRVAEDFNRQGIVAACISSAIVVEGRSSRVPGKPRTWRPKAPGKNEGILSPSSVLGHPGAIFFCGKSSQVRGPLLCWPGRILCEHSLKAGARPETR